MTSPTAVFNTLIAERIKIRQQTGRRASLPPPAATVTSSLPPTAMRQRAEFARFGYAGKPLGHGASQAGVATLSRGWVSSRSDPSPAAGGKIFTTEIGGPSPKPYLGAPLSGVNANYVTTLSGGGSYDGQAYNDPNLGAGGNAGLFSGF